MVEDDEAAVAFDLTTVAGAENAGELTLTVRRSGPPTATAEVSWATESGTATASEDLVAGAGWLTLGPEVVTTNVTIAVVNDTAVGGPETFRVRLEAPSAGPALGSQAVVTVRIDDDDRLLTHYTLSIQPATGGVVVPGGGRYPTNSVVTLTALPEHGFEVARWEGTGASADNPLALLMDRNHVLSARFRPRVYLEDFESGGLDRLPWQTGGGALLSGACGIRASRSCG